TIAPCDLAPFDLVAQGSGLAQVVLATQTVYSVESAPSLADASNTESVPPLISPFKQQDGMGPHAIETENQIPRPSLRPFPSHNSHWKDEQTVSPANKCQRTLFSSRVLGPSQKISFTCSKNRADVLAAENAYEESVKAWKSGLSGSESG
ncbi:hypothetical protein BGX29_009516, partial [Mortierella sp. GBA35]